MGQSDKQLRPGSLIASVLGLLGFLLSVISLGWQIRTYNEGLVEKALVRLSVTFDLRMHDVPPGDDDSWMRRKKVDLAVEVVNIGQHPLFVKSVRLVVPCPEAAGSEIREFQPAKDSKTGIPIDPGGAAIYRGGLWDLSQHPLDVLEPKEQYCVVVESNKGFVAKSSSLFSLSWSTTVVKEKRVQK